MNLFDDNCEENINKVYTKFFCKLCPRFYSPNKLNVDFTLKEADRITYSYADWDNMGINYIP